jgi:UDP-N-acetylglucosamine--N-acetylmuramyl-(pentapeptide) pyrophosphoryl-undecaprenol N-acetylglucosamine transferase
MAEQAHKGPVMILAGGTGGHVYPALALADYLAERGWRVVWLGTPQGLEAREVPRRGYALELINFAGLRGKGAIALTLLPLRLLRAFWQSLRALRRHKPVVVVGLGGYVAFPGAMMAALLGRPLLIHEANAVAGLTNRVLAHLADATLVAFPKALPRAMVCPTPVRRDIAAIAAPAQRYAERIGRLRMLVVGGSLGAQALNDVVPAALARLSQAQRPQVVHQSGRQHLPALQAAYARHQVEARTVDFIDDMASEYAAADVVICRAGAMTVAEVASAGVAAIFVPFPHAVDDHQSANARYLADRGAAILVPQSMLDAARLADLIGTMRRQDLLAMAQRARELGSPQATAQLAQFALGLVRDAGGGRAA